MPEKVYLNTYDMFWTNGYTSSLGIGVYHSGVEVYGTEYAFGGHCFDGTGIFQIPPKSAVDMGDNFKFKQSIFLGETDLPEDQLVVIIQQLGSEFVGQSYHLLQNNCNHFSERLSQILLSVSIPGWVNRLATAGSKIPFIEKALPKEWITPLALSRQHEQMMEERGHENGSVALNYGDYVDEQDLSAFLAQYNFEAAADFTTSSSSTSNAPPPRPPLPPR